MTSEMTNHWATKTKMMSEGYTFVLPSDDKWDALTIHWATRKVINNNLW